MMSGEQTIGTRFNITEQDLLKPIDIMKPHLKSRFKVRTTVHQLGLPIWFGLMDIENIEGDEMKKQEIWDI